jgi:hypothetical protein
VPNGVFHLPGTDFALKNGVSRVKIGGFLPEGRRFWRGLWRLSPDFFCRSGGFLHYVKPGQNILA